ncbi:hypothetical protein AN1V17_50310 [Vallitalea sediminicola]
MYNKVKVIFISLVIVTMSLSNFTTTIAMASTESESDLRITSANKSLEQRFNLSKQNVLEVQVVSPENEPRGEWEPRITQHYDVDTVIPSYWGSYHGVPANEGGNHYRECFCLRDICHQTDAGHLLGLDNENFTMLQLFAIGANDNTIKPYWPKWSYDFYGYPYYMDAGFQELPAPFELLEKIYRQYLWTGDDRWINDPEILEYAENLHSIDAFMGAHDVNNNGIADGGGNMDILPTLWEFEERGMIVEAGDTYGVQYQSLLAYAGILEARGEMTKAQEIRNRAIALREYFEENWYSEEDQIYIRAYDKFGDTRTNWGHENSFFMPMKLLTDNGPRTDRYLDFIHYNAFVDPLNEEAQTYLADTFYKHGENAMGWHWTKKVLEHNTSYPEIFFLNISNVITGMMGVEPDAPNDKVSTISRLTKEVPWVQVDNIPIGSNKISVRHDGTDQTTFENTSGSTMTWEACFYGQVDSLEVDGQTMQATVGELNGKTIAYVSLSVQSGEKKTVKANKTHPGFLYLSDQQWAYVTDEDKIKLDTSYGENAIMIDEKNYQKGLGTLANTTIRYYLDGEASRFTATVGLDDVREDQTSGSVVFRVYADNQKVFDSQIMGIADSAKEVDIDLTDVRVLDLVTYDASDGSNRDYGTWGDAKVYTNLEELPSEAPADFVYLSDISSASVGGSYTTVNKDSDYDGRTIDINERSYFKGLGVHADNEIVYDLDGLYSSFIVDVGLDESVTSNGDVIFKVYGDNNQLLRETNTLTHTSPIETMNIDVTDINQLKLVVDDAGSSYNDRANWADARLIYNPDIDLQSALVLARKIRFIDMPAVAETQLTLPEVPEGYTIGVKTSSDTSIVGVDGSITPPAAETTVTLVLEVTRLSNGEVAETNPLDVLIPSDTQISLTYFQWDLATAGYGDVELNKSNGGNSITIGGNNYDKGIGTHADSEIVYQINGQYDWFRCDIGLDDETGSNGSVVFKVYGDDDVTPLYESNVLYGTDSVESIKVNIKEHNRLKLVVTDGGDNKNHDHADWGNPMLLIDKEVTTSVYLSDLDWTSAQSGWGTVKKDTSVDGNPLTINGNTYAKGIGAHANSEIIYNLDGAYTIFYSHIGVDDEVGTNSTMVFEVYADGEKIYESGVMTPSDSYKEINEDITGVNELKLVITDAGDGINSDHGDWADAKLY